MKVNMIKMSDIETMTAPHSSEQKMLQLHKRYVSIHTNILITRRYIVVVNEQNTFGSFLKNLIKAAKMTQYEFYTALDITKPYFYDILAGKAHPPPPNLQVKALDILQSDQETRLEFFELAANARSELPADIVSQIKRYPELKEVIRNYCTQKHNN